MKLTVVSYGTFTNGSKSKIIVRLVFNRYKIFVVMFVVTDVVLDKSLFCRHDIKIKLYQLAMCRVLVNIMTTLVKHFFVVV